MTRALRVFDDVTALAAAAADEWLTRAADAIAARGRFTAVLSGGSTSRHLFTALAARVAQGAAAVPHVAWEQVHVFWGDERTVPPSHPDSNYGSARTHLLARLPVPEVNVHRMEGERPDPKEAAADYDAEIRRVLGLRAGERPAFDLVCLGLGPDAHTASLFPGSPALAEQERLVTAPWVDEVGAHRITLTPLAFGQARVVIFLVAGVGKAEALRDVLEQDPDPARRPAQAIQPVDGSLTWMADRAAARLLAPATLAAWRAEDEP